jgi:hypothetical protein
MLSTPSSSLVLRLCSTLLFTPNLICSVVAAPPEPARLQSPTYSLAKQYSGSTFFNDFDFFSTSDPTHGFVTYGDRATSQANGLISFDGEYAVMKVDSRTNLGKGRNYYQRNGNRDYFNVNGVGRKSVRIEGTYEFTHGLIIADIGQMPSNICGTWPAFWTLGKAQWPMDGELDIIEGSKYVNPETRTLYPVRVP